MRLKPVNDKIVVKPIEADNDNVTEGGILLPDSVHDGSLVEGKVVAVGDGMYSASGTLIPVICNVGDTIIYNKNTHKSDYNIDNQDYIVMSVNEVVSIVLPEENK